MFNQQVEQGDNTAFFQQHVRGNVIGADRDLRREVRQRFQGVDNLGQQVGMRAADLQRHPGAQFFQRIVGGGELMVRGDARRQICL